MMRLINNYRSLSFENKTIFMTKFSIMFNGIMAILKILFTFYGGVYFFVAGIVNVFIMFAKLECYLGVKKLNNIDFKERNIKVGVFLLAAGLVYAIYMSRLIFTDVKLMKYDMILGIIIACVAFVEIGIAIKGVFNSIGKGHYYRNIKLINFCTALTAIALTEVALTSFASETDTRFMDGLFGMIVGLIMILMGVFVFIAPKVSIIDREHNIYSCEDSFDNSQEFAIQLTYSKYYANYYYKGVQNGNLVDGRIVKGKTPIWKWNIWLLIIVMILSEILIFPYAIGALVFYFKNGKLIQHLDNEMLKRGYQKVLESEE